MKEFNSTCLRTSDLLSCLQRAAEGSSKRAELIPDGDTRSVLLLKPAFKAYADGSQVSVGDLVTFVTKKNIGGSSFVLHMSNLAELHADRAMITRALKTDHECIVSGQEVNFAAVETRPTMFRVMVFQSCKQQDQAGVLKGEDVITLYHKNFSAFLHFDEEIHADPVFYLSKRVNNKARKKCAWMWKVERVEVMSAAHSVSATEDTIIRLKHLVTNMYLKQQEGTLAVTTSYLDPATQFSLKQFHKAADPEVVKHEDTIFVRGVSGAWLGLNAEDDDDNIRTVPTFLRHTEVAPDSEALIILPIRSTALSNVVEVQRLGLTISDFRKQLSVMPIRGKNSSESRANVFAVVDECYDGLLRVLRTLIVNCTYDSNPDPMSRRTAEQTHAETTTRARIYNPSCRRAGFTSSKGCVAGRAFHAESGRERKCGSPRPPDESLLPLAQTDGEGEPEKFKSFIHAPELISLPLGERCAGNTNVEGNFCRKTRTDQAH